MSQPAQTWFLQQWANSFLHGIKVPKAPMFFPAIAILLRTQKKWANQFEPVDLIIRKATRRRMAFRSRG
jgi:hypothetical protein